MDRIIEGTKQEAVIEEAKLRLGFKKEAPSSAWAGQTFRSFCLDSYADAARNNLKASTWQKRKYVLRVLVRFLGPLSLSEAASAASVEKFKAERIRAGLSRVSINNELRVLRRVLRWALQVGALEGSVRIDFFKQRTRHRLDGAWSQEEVARLLVACLQVSPTIFPMVLFLATTGSRRGEALALPWKHVDLRSGVVRIWAVEPSGAGDDDSKQWSPKTMEREVPIPDAMLPYLTGPRISSEWVFPSSDKARYAYWPSLQFDRARDAAGLKGGPHKLRHTYASHFLQKNPNLFLLGRIMGHTHTRVTELYSHLVSGYLDAAKNVVTFDVPSVVPGALSSVGQGDLARNLAQAEGASASEATKAE